MRPLRAGLALAMPLLLGGALTAAPAKGSRELTIPAIFDGTFDGRPATAPAWSPEGERLAWLQRDADAQPVLLHLLEAASGATRALTAPDEGPARLEVDAFRWAPSGKSLLIESGGDLYLMEAEGGVAPRRLTQTASAETTPRFSPDGAWLAFRRDGEIVTLEIATGVEQAITSGSSPEILNGVQDWVYDEEFGTTDAFWWSPDSRAIAWMRFDQRDVPRYPIVDWSPVHPEVRWQHYPKAGDTNATVRLGVTPAGAAAPPIGQLPRTRWIDVGGNPDIYLPRVAWTPDGRLAVQRLDREQRHLDLLLCPAAEGSCRAVLQESDPFWLNVGDDWRFLKNAGAGRPGFIWGSTRDGWRHLYLFDMEGKLLRQLTRGAWEVTELEGVDEAAQMAWFTATEADPKERHLYRVALNGSAPPARLTQEPGTHAATVSPRGAWFDSLTTERYPARATAHRADGTMLATLDPGVGPLLDGYRRGVTEFLTVPAADGTPLPAMITKPPDFDPKRRYPVLVYVYGGPHAQVVSRSWGSGRMLWHQMMAARGLVIWSLDNRGAAARGHAWETPLHRRMGKVELADQLYGVDWLKRQQWVDPDRIGLWGWSYGGYMTLYSLLNAPGAFRCGVSVAPVTDWRDYDTIYTERYMDRPADNPEGYRDASPVHKAEALTAPLLLVHGSADDNVHMQNSVQLLNRFVAAGRPVEFLLYPGKTHSIAGKEARTHLYEAITRFLERNLIFTKGR